MLTHNKLLKDNRDLHAEFERTNNELGKDKKQTQIELIEKDQEIKDLKDKLQGQQDILQEQYFMISFFFNCC